MRRRSQPLPKEFLEWQVQLRRWTMRERNGAPHIGVVPVVQVARPEGNNGIVGHSVVCGLLPHPRLLESKTRAFRETYEAAIDRGARAVYDAGIALLLDYYEASDDFDPESVTTLLPKSSPLAIALRAAPVCSLVFNVFEAGPDSRSSKEPVRCTQIDARAEVLERGAVYDNVWWHNTLFHGMADDHVVIHFRHERSWDTRFGNLVSLVD